jgi:hypothetical protein
MPNGYNLNAVAKRPSAPVDVKWLAEGRSVERIE